MKSLATAVVATLSTVALSTSVAAQDASLGAEIYQDRCAVCHGDTGAGDGMVGELFTQKPKDLKLLAKENGGLFPFFKVYAAIDGRANIAAHGRSEMPVWGTFFMQDAIDDPTINDKNARYITAGRILSLAYYLQTIQTE